MGIIVICSPDVSTVTVLHVRFLWPIVDPGLWGRV